MSTQTATRNVTMEKPLRNPKDSMKSTWRQANRSEWTPVHWFYEILKMHPTYLDKPVPVHPKTDKVPHITEWSLHQSTLVHAFFPIVLHQAYVTYTGHNLNPFVAFLFYMVAFNFNAIHKIHVLRRLGHIYGFLDGDMHERDGVPDVGVTKVANALMLTSNLRPMFTVFLSYHRTQAPVDSIGWFWLPLETGLYGIILDFWFYWYHRLMHEVDGLWKYHRTHHLTKHPNPMLTPYADHEQGVFDIMVIPLMTYFTMKLMGLPMGFYDWWVCHQYILFSELAGHSGLRVHTVPPSSLSWLLRYFNVELTIEDHDLHHRNGWRKSYNYGKQTRLWDRVFGTCHERIECTPDNIDYENTVVMPTF